MPKLIVLQTVVVSREGKRVVPQIGQPFEFTAAEAKDIKALQPSAVRSVINEEAPPEPEVDAGKTSGKTAAKTTKAADDGKVVEPVKAGDTL